MFHGALIALAGTLIPLSFAAYTDHAWEDWYITFRAAKNLALGNGFVFTAGERVHSFTSPIGTLLPAFFSWITGSASDQLVLWLFRIVSSVTLAAAAFNLYLFGRGRGMSPAAVAMLIAAFLIDARIVDFSINGMEVAYTCYFITLALLGWNATGVRWYVITAVAWAGLMWSRPDGFIYAAAIASGQLLFMPELEAGASRLDLLRRFLIAGVIALAMYLPWTIWTWLYYGTPMPHTIAAKALQEGSRHTSIFYKLLFPLNVLIAKERLIYTFAPPYYGFGDWPPGLLYFSHGVAALVALLWFVPKVDRDVRALSFATFVGHFYLKNVAYWIAPWYVPPVTLLSIVTLGVAASRLAKKVDYPVIHMRRLVTAASSLLLVLSVMMTMAVAYQFRIQQSVVERGNREQIGHWLAAHAATPKDTVFIECLGYVGFYSNLKMLDYPGMSSPEMVAARRSYGEDYATLIDHLKPNWLVLRPAEVARIDESIPNILSTRYAKVKEFDVRERVNSYGVIPGKGLLMNDAVFHVYKQK